jgi:flagellar basal-body rod modification protein FlgD
MTVTNVDSSILDAITSAYTTSTETEEDSDGLLMEDFLTIFLAQLQNQDPLNPMDSTDMTAQMAQITTVEQLYNCNTNLAEISQKLDNQQESDLLDYIGKEITVEGSAMTVDDDGILGGTFYIDEAADVEVIIYDTDGNEIKQIDLGDLESGEHEVGWDGTDAYGNTVENGAYVYEVLATDINGDYIAVQTTYSGVVTGVTYSDDTAYLVIGDGYIDPESVIEVRDPADDEAVSENDNA